MAAAGAAGVFAFGLRVVAWDGTGIDVPGTAENAREFGGPAGGGPQLRLLALIECGTRALIDAAFDGFAKVSEQVLARRLLHALRPGMLLLADRAFPGYQLRGLAAAAGADLAWRVRSSAVLTPVRYLPDGSYLSVLPTPHDARQGRKLRARGRPQAGHRVRVIPCSVTVTAVGGTTRTEAFRLVTTLLDWEQAPAAELAALYRERREAENGYGELKTRLRGAGFILRSQAPELACQEMRAFLAVFQALSSLQYQAARQAGLDPDRLSFTVTIRIARDHARTQHALLTPGGLARARQHAITDMLADLLPPRRDRHYDREKKRPRNSNYPTRKNNEPRPPPNITYHIHIIRKTPQPSQTP